MAFGRKKNKDEEPEVEAAAPEAVAEEPAPIAATTGPYDLADLPEDDETPRLDLGGMRIPVPQGTEIRVDVSPEGQIVSAVAVNGQSQMQVNAFAAPRREGIWDDVRAEILKSLRNEGGQPEEVDGPFGRELRAQIPVGNGQTTPSRFIGVDGPRWFLRGLMTGPAAVDPAQAAVLESVFRGVVVVRGNDAMAPRDIIPLRLPKEAEEAGAAAQAAAQRAAQEQAAAGQAGQAGQGDGSGEQGRFQGGDFNPFERGPEITETR